MAGIHYEYMNESAIDDNYKCPICNDPFRQPVTTPCDHTYCQECIEEWFRQDHSTCPACRETISSNDLIPVTTRLVLNVLDRLVVRCPDCEQSGIQRGNLNDHLMKACPKGSINCSAVDIKCSWSGARDELSNHLATCIYEQMRPVLAHLIRANQELEEQVQTLSQQVRILQLAVDSPTRRLISFDKLSEIHKKTDSGLMSEEYEGLNWTNVWYMHEQWVKTNHPHSGWKNAYTRGHTCIGFNGKGNSCSIRSRRPSIDTFSLISFEATSAWHDNLQVIVIGRRGKQEIYSVTVLMQFDSSQVFKLDWDDIDEVNFTPINGKSHPGSQYTEKYFALTWLLLG